MDLSESRSLVAAAAPCERACGALECSAFGCRRILETPGRAAVAPVLSFSPHPILLASGRELVYARFLSAETIEHYLERTGILARMGRQPFILTINGRQVPRELWRGCRPKPGTLINLYAIVRDGGGKKNPLATIAMIALMVYAPHLGASLASSMGLGGTAILGVSAGQLLGVGIGVASGLAINKLFPPPKPALSQAQQPGSVSPTYAIQGGSNQVRRYEPMMKIIGSHRVFPDFGALPYSEFIGEDQWGFYVFDFGYNDVDLSDFRIGGNPLDNFNTDLLSVSMEISGADGKLSFFPANVDSQEGAALTANADGSLPGPWIQRTSSPNTTSLAVDLTGFLFAVDSTSGAIVNTGAGVGIEYRAVGAADWLPFWEGASLVSLQNATRKPLRKTYKINVVQGQYEVRMRKWFADSVAPNFTHEFSWSQLRSYQPDTADYTGRKRVGLAIRASGQLTGVLQQFSAYAEAYCQVWNGAAWVRAKTSRPAWWILDVLRGKVVNGRRVWGANLPDGRIDLEGLKAYGAFCDAEDLAYDGVFDQQLSVQDMLSQIALIGRATPSLGTGKHGVVWDAPNLPVTSVFGMHNIIAGSFSIDYANEDLAEVIEGWFINPELDWQRDFVRVQVPGTTGTAKVRRIELKGCRNRARAAQLTNLWAAQNAYRARTYRWRSDWEAMPCSRGEVTALSHDLTSFDYSGRLVEGGSAALLKLARKVPLQPGGAWITIVKPDGTMATYAVAGGAGMTDTLTPTPALPFDPNADPNHPPYDYKFLYGPTATPGKKVKIEGFKPVSERVVELSAIDEDPAFYAAKDNPYAYTPPKPVFGNAPVIANLQLSEDGVRTGNGYLAKVHVVWDASGDYGFADIRISEGGAPLRLAGQEIRARSFEFTVSDRQDVTVEITAYSSMGRLGKSARLTAAQHIDFAALSPPDSVGSFTLEGDTFRWTPVSAVDVKGYIMRFHYGENRELGTAARLHEGLLTFSPVSFPELPAGRVTFLLTAIDAADLESAAPAVIIKDLGDAELHNVLETLDFKALGWPGTLTGGAVVGANLEADPTTGFYGQDSESFYGQDDAPFYEDEVYAQMVYETEAFTFPYELVGSTLVLSHEISGKAVTIEYRRDNQEPFYGLDGDPFYGPDGDSFYGPLGAWKPWTGSVTFEGGKYWLRITTSGASVKGVVSELTAYIDVPDVEELLQNIAIGAGGTRLPVTKPFREIKNIQLTLQGDGGVAAGVRILDYQVDPGPLVECTNGAVPPVAVAGHVTALIKGR